MSLVGRPNLGGRIGPKLGAALLARSTAPYAANDAQGDGIPDANGYIGSL